jgi:hypothetical protein
MANENIEYIINGDVIRSGEMVLEGKEYVIEVRGTDTELVAQLFDLCPMKLVKYEKDLIKEKLKNEPSPFYGNKVDIGNEDSIIDKLKNEPSPSYDKEKEISRKIKEILKSPTGDPIKDYLKKT